MPLRSKLIQSATSIRSRFANTIPPKLELWRTNFDHRDLVFATWRETRVASAVICTLGPVWIIPITTVATQKRERRSRTHSIEFKSFRLVKTSPDQPKTNFRRNSIHVLAQHRPPKVPASSPLSQEHCHASFGSSSRLANMSERLHS